MCSKAPKHRKASPVDKSLPPLNFRNSAPKNRWFVDEAQNQGFDFLKKLHASSAKNHTHGLQNSLGHQITSCGMVVFQSAGTARGSVPRGSICCAGGAPANAHNRVGFGQCDGLFGGQSFTRNRWKDEAFTPGSQVLDVLCGRP